MPQISNLLKEFIQTVLANQSPKKALECYIATQALTGTKHESLQPLVDEVITLGAWDLLALFLDHGFNPSAKGFTLVIEVNPLFFRHRFSLFTCKSWEFATCRYRIAPLIGSPVEILDYALTLPGKEGVQLVNCYVLELYEKQPKEHARILLTALNTWGYSSELSTFHLSEALRYNNALPVAEQIEVNLPKFEVNNIPPQWQIHPGFAPYLPTPKEIDIRAEILCFRRTSAQLPPDTFTTLDFTNAVLLNFFHIYAPYKDLASILIKPLPPKSWDEYITTQTHLSHPTYSVSKANQIAFFYPCLAPGKIRDKLCSNLEYLLEPSFYDPKPTNLLNLQGATLPFYARVIQLLLEGKLVSSPDSKIRKSNKKYVTPQGQKQYLKKLQTAALKVWATPGPHTPQELHDVLSQMHISKLNIRLAALTSSLEFAKFLKLSNLEPVLINAIKLDAASQVVELLNAIQTNVPEQKDAIFGKTLTACFEYGASRTMELLAKQPVSVENKATLQLLTSLFDPNSVRNRTKKQQFRKVHELAPN